MRDSIVAKIRNWEPGKRLVLVPKKKKIMGEIVISKKGNIYYSYYKRSLW